MKKRSHSKFKKFMLETMQMLAEEDPDKETKDNSEEPDKKEKSEDDIESTELDLDTGEDVEDPKEDEDGLDVEEELKPSATDSIIDSEIERQLAKAEHAGLAVAAKEDDRREDLGIPESRSYSLKKVMFEADDAEPSINKSDVVLDVETYAFNVARLINNYMNLLDMERTIFDKAKSYLADKYDSDVADKFESVMADEYDISFKPKDNIEAPHAVGAMNTSQTPV